MRTIKQLISIIFFSIVLTGCEENKDTENHKSSLVNFSGKELFKGILFAQGDVAKLIPPIQQSYSYYEINNMDSTFQKKSDDKITALLNFIEVENPNYFNNFKDAITSKNHILIRDSLISSSNLLYETSLNLFMSTTEKTELKNLLSNLDIENYTNDDGSINKEKLRNEITKSNSFSLNQTGKGTCWFAGVVIVAAAYVVVVHAAAAMIYVAVAWVAEAYAAIDQAKTITRGNQVPAPNHPPVKKVEDLEMERLIDKIAIM